MKQHTFLGVAWAMACVLAVPFPAAAQSYAEPSVAVPAEMPAGSLSHQDQLNRLVSPIASYPDAIVRQVLDASAYPGQVTDADFWIAERLGLDQASLQSEIAEQPWDPSVKALCAYPNLLNMMNVNLDWVAQLHQAYSIDAQAVLDSVASLRGNDPFRHAQAYSAPISQSPGSDAFWWPTVAYSSAVWSSSGPDGRGQEGHARSGQSGDKGHSQDGHANRGGRRQH